MILIDMNQVVISSIFASDKTKLSSDLRLLRHVVISSLFSYRREFPEKEYGTMVLCWDSFSWRKLFFKQYKAKRKEFREASEHNWVSFYDSLNQIQRELSHNFPYICMRVDDAEADDIISVIADYSTKLDKNVLIISDDKDFQQLQINPKIRQWSPKNKSWIVCENPTTFIVEHIIRGDSTDGIPNVCSDDEIFITDGKRQTPIRTKCVEAITNELEQCGMSFCDIPEDALFDLISKHIESADMDNYSRNRTLIVWNNIPDYLKNNIIREFEMKEREDIPTFERMKQYMADNNLIKLGETV